MSSLTRLAKSDESLPLQEMLNQSQNTKFLGGFTPQAVVSSKINAGLAVISLEDDKIAGVTVVTEKLDHRYELQLTATDKNFRSSGHAENTYAWWVRAALLSGRFHIIDHIVGDNPMMPFWLPRLGFRKSFKMMGKVRRHHSLTYWTLDLSTVEKKKIAWALKPETAIEFDGDTLDKFDANFAKMSQLFRARGEHDLVDELEKRREWVISL